MIGTPHSDVLACPPVDLATGLAAMRLLVALCVPQMKYSRSLQVVGGRGKDIGQVLLVRAVTAVLAVASTLVTIRRVAGRRGRRGRGRRCRSHRGRRWWRWRWWWNRNRLGCWGRRRRWWWWWWSGCAIAPAFDLLCQQAYYLTRGERMVTTRMVCHQDMRRTERTH